MSQAAKQVDWCLKKATKEIEECKKQNIRPRHRGLLQIALDKNEAIKHIEKAEHNLKSAIHFAKTGYSDWSITASFYSMYHCFLAIGYAFGYESGNQSCTISLMENLKEEGKIDIDSKYLKMFQYQDEESEDSLIEMRETYTYGTRKEASKDKVDELTSLCKELIEITKKTVFSK